MHQILLHFSMGKVNTESPFIKNQYVTIGHRQIMVDIPFVSLPEDWRFVKFTGMISLSYFISDENPPVKKTWKKWWKSWSPSLPRGANLPLGTRSHLRVWLVLSAYKDFYKGLQPLLTQDQIIPKKSPHPSCFHGKKKSHSCQWNSMVI